MRTAALACLAARRERGLRRRRGLPSAHDARTVFATNKRLLRPCSGPIHTALRKAIEKEEKNALQRPMSLLILNRWGDRQGCAATAPVLLDRREPMLATAVHERLSLVELT